MKKCHMKKYSRNLGEHHHHSKFIELQTWIFDMQDMHVAMVDWCIIHCLKYLDKNGKLFYSLVRKLSFYKNSYLLQERNIFFSIARPPPEGLFAISPERNEGVTLFFYPSAARVLKARSHEGCGRARKKDVSFL